MSEQLPRAPSALACAAVFLDAEDPTALSACVKNLQALLQDRPIVTGRIVSAEIRNCLSHHILASMNDADPVVAEDIRTLSYTDIPVLRHSPNTGPLCLKMGAIRTVEDYLVQREALMEMVRESGSEISGALLKELLEKLLFSGLDTPDWRLELWRMLRKVPAVLAPLFPYFLDVGEQGDLKLLLPDVLNFHSSYLDIQHAVSIAKELAPELTYPEAKCLLPRLLTLVQHVLGDITDFKSVWLTHEGLFHPDGPLGGWNYLS